MSNKICAKTNGFNANQALIRNIFICAVADMFKQMEVKNGTAEDTIASFDLYNRVCELFYTLDNKLFYYPVTQAGPDKVAAIKLFREFTADPDPVSFVVSNQALYESICATNSQARGHWDSWNRKGELKFYERVGLKEAKDIICDYLDAMNKYDTEGTFNTSKSRQEPKESKINSLGELLRSKLDKPESY